MHTPEHSPTAARVERRRAGRWRWAACLLAIATVLTGCGDTDDTGDTTAAPAADQGVGDGASPAEDDPTAAEQDATEAPEAAATEDDASGASAGGTATASVDGQLYEFQVVNCLVDEVSPLTDEPVPFLLDGVAPDAPEELVAPLRGPLTDEQAEELDGADMQALLEPVLAHGPVLSIARTADDGESDTVILQFEDGIVHQAGFGGFLEISEGDDVTVTGTSEFVTTDPDAGESDGGELTVEATCS